MKSIPFGMLKCSIFLKLTPLSGAYLTHSFHIHNLSPLLKDYPASIHLIKIPKFLFPGRPFLGFPSCDPWCFVLSLTMRKPLDMICISLWCCSLMLSLTNCMMFLLAIWHGNLPWQSKAHPWSVSCDWTWWDVIRYTLWGLSPACAPFFSIMWTVLPLLSYWNSGAVYLLRRLISAWKDKSKTHMMISCRLPC